MKVFTMVVAFSAVMLDILMIYSFIMMYSIMISVTIKTTENHIYIYINRVILIIEGLIYFSAV